MQVNVGGAFPNLGFQTQPGPPHQPLVGERGWKRLSDVKDSQISMSPLTSCSQTEHKRLHLHFQTAVRRRQEVKVQPESQRVQVRIKTGNNVANQSQQDVNVKKTGSDLHTSHNPEVGRGQRGSFTQELLQTKRASFSISCCSQTRFCPDIRRS